MENLTPEQIASLDRFLRVEVTAFLFFTGFILLFYFISLWKIEHERTKAFKEQRRRSQKLLNRVLDTMDQS